MRKHLLLCALLPKLSLLLFTRESELLLRVTPDARTETVTSQVAILPFVVLTIIVAVSTPTAVTIPSLTVAILGFDDDQTN